MALRPRAGWTSPGYPRWRGRAARARSAAVVVAAAVTLACGGGVETGEAGGSTPQRVVVRDGVRAGDGEDPDGDHVASQQDQCPMASEDFDGFEDEDGCPEPDNDQDGIGDADDFCPNEAEVFNGTEDEDGCPDVGHVIVRVAGRMPTTQLDRVFFAEGSAAIEPEALPVLDAVAAALGTRRAVRLVEVGAHADDPGDEEADLALSRRRAEAVVAYLVSRGVESSRLRARGYGDACPIDANDTDRARERNRRVELTVVETTDGPAPNPGGCEPPEDASPDEAE